MAEKKNVINLEEAMGKKPRESSGGVSIDLTKPMDTIPTNEPEVQAEETIKKAETVEIGHIDSESFENMESIKPTDILPNRKPKPTMEDDLFGALDAAVDRECEKITERVDAITAVQKEEFDEKVKAVEDAKQAEEDNFAINGSVDSSSNADDADALLGDDFLDDDDTEDIKPVSRVSVFDDNDTQKEKENNMEEIKETVEIDATKAEPIAEAATEETVTEENATVEETAAPVEEVKEETKKEEVKAETIKEEEPEKPMSILSGIDDDSLFDDDEEDSTDDGTDDSDKAFEDLKAEVKEKITPIKKSIDLSKFTIAKKSINASKLLKLAVKDHQCVADWVSYAAERPISLTGLSGSEILKLNPDNSTRNRLNTFRDMYRVIYDHIYDGNKPEFETWLKQTKFVDLPHIQFGLYMATFQGSNFVTYSCPNNKCNKVFIKDVDFKDMIVYASDEVKQKVQDMLKMDTTSKSNDSYDTDLIPISDNYVFALKTPSIYNVIIETASLSDQFIEKYADLIDVVSYIDGIYLIDYDTNSLIPVDTKPDPNDQAKTSARRIKVFHDIISKLSSEDYYRLRAEINNYDKSANDITYQIPACTCPDCATEIPANTNMSPDNMLFTRHQLAAIGNM